MSTLFPVFPFWRKCKKALFLPWPSLPTTWVETVISFTTVSSYRTIVIKEYHVLHPWIITWHELLLNLKKKKTTTITRYTFTKQMVLIFWQKKKKKNFQEYLHKFRFSTKITFIAYLHFTMYNQVEAFYLIYRWHTKTDTHILSVPFIHFNDTDTEWSIFPIYSYQIDLIVK